MASGDELARKGETQRAARAAGLPADPRPSLSDVDRRRTQLWTLTIVVMVVLSAAIAMLSLSGQVTYQTLGLENHEWIPAVLVVGLALAFLIYVYDKNRSLRRLQDLLIDERVFSTGLTTRLADVSSLSEVARALTTTLELKSVLDLILSSARDLFDADDGSVMLLAEGQLEVVAAQGPAADVVTRGRTKLAQGISGRVATRNQAVLLHGSDLPPPFMGEGHPGRGIHSAMCAPLVRRDQLLGVLNLSESRGQRTYTDLDLQVLAVLTAHAAIAIGNAHLFEGEKQTVARLEELDRLKSDFVATVSHELKTPLTAIIGAAKTVSRKGATMDPTQHAEFMGMIERQGSRLLRLVEDVLTTARIESGQRRLRRELVNMRTAIEPIIDELHLIGVGHDRQIELRCDPQDPTVWGDLSSVQQIAGNLLENALKYGGASAPVVINVREAPGESVIEVIDKGPGLSKDEIDTIFERFQQVESEGERRPGGVGLGLFIVKGLVDAHRGKIEVESAQGHGTTFRVTFPKRSSDRE